MAILTFFYELADVLLKHFSFKKVNWESAIFSYRYIEA